MVKTRGMSNYDVNRIEEAFVNTDNLDADTESLLTNICLDLKQLEANHPHITLSDLQQNISSLLHRLDDALASEKSSGAIIKDLKCNVLTLESRLEREKQQRHSELNASFNELDIIRDEKDVVLQKNNGMLTSLNDVKAKLKNKSGECISLQSLISEKDSIIVRLKSDLVVSNNQKLELAGFVTDLKSSVKKAEENSWLKSRWVDDTILDTFFQSFSGNNKDSLSKVIFMGPSVTQFVIHGTCDDVEDHLGKLMFNNFDYAFLCVGNSSATLKQDTGSHWSLLFVDISSHLVYHLDSLLGMNSAVAKAVTIKLGFKANSFHELSCTQQNNSYECGLSVLVNAKFINEGFCHKTMRGTGSSFSHWYALFVDGPSGLLIRDKSEVAPSEPTPAEPNQHNSDNILSSSTINCGGAPSTKNSGKWVKVKPKGIRTKNTGTNVNSLPSNHIVKCKNRFQALELESTCINDTIISNSSGKWQRKSPIRLTNKPRIPNQSSSKVGKETFTHRNVVHSDVRVKVSSGTGSPKYTSQANERIRKTSMPNVLLIGDSLLRYSGKRCADSGAIVDVNPGARISHIKDKLGKYKSAQPKIIYLLVGTNNLVHGYNGGPGYNGGWGKRMVLHSMADLLSTARQEFPNSIIIVNSVLTRNDISQKALFYFNEQLMLMCNNFNVEFLDTSAVVHYHHLARDGTHLNRKGNDSFGDLIFHSLKIIHEAVSAEPKVVCPSPQFSHTDDSDSSSLSGNWSGNGTETLPTVVE